MNQMQMTLPDSNTYHVIVKSVPCVKGECKETPAEAYCVQKETPHVLAPETVGMMRKTGGIVAKMVLG